MSGGFIKGLLIFFLGISAGLILKFSFGGDTIVVEPDHTLYRETKIYYALDYFDPTEWSRTPWSTPDA